MDKSQNNYNNRDVNYYMNQISVQILEKLSVQERENIYSVIQTAIPRSTPKLIDLRFVIDIVFARYFVVLMVGRDIRKQQRHYQVSGITKIANVIVAILLVIAMSLLISSVTILVIYLIKSALGIDLFPGHITKVLFRN